jgi:hypothetical protein
MEEITLMDQSGADLLFNRILSREEIQDALMRIFNVRLDEIFITKDISDESEVFGNEIRILCETLLYVQDTCIFPFRVDLYLRDHSLASMIDEDAFVRLCNILRCQIILSDDSPAATSWLLATPDGVRPIALHLDEICNSDFVEHYEVL